MKLEPDENLFACYLSNLFPEQRIFTLRNKFSKDGFIKVNDIADTELKHLIKNEVLTLLEQQGERRDLLLTTTDNSPRHMSVVRSEWIAQQKGLIYKLARSPNLLELLSRIAGTEVIPQVSNDEEFLITRQEKKGDTHGWHWGDYSFALIWIIETPPISCGGMLQCVPHTYWDKNNSRINEILSNHPISTYGFLTGDIYFLRTDTTLHRTVPLSDDVTRIILNMTWADKRLIDKPLSGNDRWWEDKHAAAVRTEQ
ncbi:MAG: HalD/BesD family halogenase [Pseudomonas sp.]|uniref:HalD/BesD family halogenase n=1 Tax=Pseudomonas sp. TaxID=306 RepID=UPI003D6EB8CB